MNRRTAILAACALSACSVLPTRPYQAPRTWPLTVAPPNPVLAAPPGAPTLLVRTLRAAPGFEPRGLQTLTQNGSLTTDPWEEWSAPPAQAAEAELRGYLSETGLFSAVVAPGTRLSPSYALEGELTALWAQPQAGLARARIGYVLIDLRQNSTLVLQDVAEGTAPLQGAGSEASQAAQRAAMGNAFAQIAAQIGAAIHSPRGRRQGI